MSIAEKRLLRLSARWISDQIGILVIESKAGSIEAPLPVDGPRLLRQIETLQDALWKHAVLPTADSPSENSEPEFIGELRFKASAGGFLGEDARGSLKNDSSTSREEKRKRKYQRTKLLQRPRHWRTRRDPFEAVWNEICQWLAANPERTAKSLFAELQKHYPDQFADNQLRTLERWAQVWRAKVILTFDDQWLEEDMLATEVLPRPLGVVMEPNNIRSECST